MGKFRILNAHIKTIPRNCFKLTQHPLQSPWPTLAQIYEEFERREACCCECSGGGGGGGTDDGYGAGKYVCSS